MTSEWGEQGHLNSSCWCRWQGSRSCNPIEDSDMKAIDKADNDDMVCSSAGFTLLQIWGYLLRRTSAQNDLQGPHSPRSHEPTASSSQMAYTWRVSSARPSPACCSDSRHIAVCHVECLQHMLCRHMLLYLVICWYRTCCLDAARCRASLEEKLCRYQ